MVDNDSISGFLLQCFFKSNDGTVHPHVITDMKACDFAAVSIGYQVQVSKTFLLYRYVSNISHPKLMSMQWCKTLYQVGIAEKEMFAVGGVHTCFSPAYQQLVFRQQIQEIISAHTNVLLPKEGLQHHQQFTAAAAWLMFADAKHLLYDALFVAYLLKLMLLMFIISLP